MIDIVSSDGTVFTVDKEDLRSSDFLWNLVQDLDTTDVHIHKDMNINSSTLGKVLEFCRMSSSTSPSSSSSTTDQINEWMNDYVGDSKRNKTQKISLPLKGKLLLELIAASEYLNVGDLSKLAKKKVAGIVPHLKQGQLAYMLGIELEAEEKIASEHPWAYKNRKPRESTADDD